MVRNKKKGTQTTNMKDSGFQRARVNINNLNIPSKVLEELSKSYSQFQAYFPLLERFRGTAPISYNSGLVATTPFPEGDDDNVYVKVIHLLNPTDWIQGNYSFPKDVSMPGIQDSWGTVVDKLQCEENQAYVDALSVSLLSQLAEQNLSPHFIRYYGTICAKAEKYCYNMNDDYQSYRNTKWFWKQYESNQFKIRIFSDEKKRFLNDDEVAPFLLKPDEADLIDDDDDEEEILDEIGDNNENADREVELESVGSFSTNSGSVQSILRISPSNQTLQSGSEASSEMDGYDIFAEFTGMPVMLIFMEKMEESVDSLLGEDTYDENKWTAWIWQIICALIQAFSFIELYHNDLHGNNILYSTTTEEFIYYRTKDNQVWRVPTFGKIFRIIDFGRAILRAENQSIISDDFHEGNDAAGQYNFGSIRDPKEAAIPPNQSFDLARLAVSIFDTLFEETPASKGSGAVLSKEGNWVVKETVSPLYNLLWTWMLDIKGRNILKSEDGEERYPGFDLYKHIAANCKNAVPKDQLRKPIFEKFKYTGIVPEGVTVYPLFI
jgi:hypothetical protein